MAPDNYRVVGSPHYHDGEFYADGEVIEDVPETLLRRFPDKFEAVDESESEAEDVDEDGGSDEPDDPDEAEAQAEDESEPEPEPEPVEDEPDGEPDAPSGIPDDHTTLRRIASQHDLGEGVDGRSSSDDIVAALEEIPEDEREEILSDTDTEE